MASETLYCTQCTRPGDVGARFCEACGAPRAVSRQRRGQQIAVILNELQAPPMAAVLLPRQREQLQSAYAGQLRGLSEPAQQPAPAWRSPAPQRRDAAQEVALPSAPPRTPPPPPREPMDWRWLGEQQANLFLFAGAFLTVVAALIYVSYSGQAVSGALKMSMLAAYTLAFLAVGWVCYRVPRVEMAGRVFFAVGAILVPMNFVAARELFGHSDLSTESLWLSGSIVTAAFYASFAMLGVGRLYGVGAGFAAISGAIAGTVIADVPVEWAAVPLIPVGLAMTLTASVRNERVRASIGQAWLWQGQTLAVAAVVFAIAVISLVDVPRLHINRWHLPVTMLTFMSAAIVAFVVRRDAHLGVAAAAGFAGAWMSLPFALNATGEWYGLGAAALALPFGAFTLACRDARIAPHLPARSEEFAYVAGVGSTLVSAVIFLSLLAATTDGIDPYVFSHRWTIGAAAVIAIAFFATDTFVALRRPSVAGVGIAGVALAASAVFAFEGALEFYAYALAASGVVLMSAARWLPGRGAIAAIEDGWRDDARIIAGLATTAGALVALGLALDATFGNISPYEPVTRWFLPIALALTFSAVAIDASRRATPEATAAALIALGALALSLPWTFEAIAAWYGITLVAWGVALAAGGRIWSPAWVHADTRDIVATCAVGVATIPFETAYAAWPRAGAGVHLAAAFFFAAAAVRYRDADSDVRAPLDLSSIINARVEALWLYVAGGAAIAGYLWVLQALPTDDASEPGTIAMPMLAASLAFAALGALAKRVQPSFRAHLYAMSLASAIVALAATADVETLAGLLTIFVALSIVVAAYEDAPQLDVPAIVFGLLAVVAWTLATDSAETTIPLAYAAIALSLYATAFALRAAADRWSSATRIAGATFAAAGPVAGLLLLSGETGPLAPTDAWLATALAVAAAALVIAGESFFSARRWLLVPASAVLLIAALMGIARLEPASNQAYTVTLGVYALALSLIGLRRLRLWPDAISLSPWLESAGVALIAWPTFLDSLDHGGQYQLLLIAESVALLAVSIVLRRRAMLATAAGFLTLAGGRVLLDAVNVMPNWIVVMIAGVALLGIGTLILIGRDRWDRWEAALVKWWADDAEAQTAWRRSSPRDGVR
jgi:hypothetical protein